MTIKRGRENKKIAQRYCVESVMRLSFDGDPCDDIIFLSLTPYLHVCERVLTYFSLCVSLDMCAMSDSLSNVIDVLTCLLGLFDWRSWLTVCNV